MNDKDLAAAIEVAHIKIRGTAPSEPTHIPWVVNFKMLLAEQLKRATVQAPAAFDQGPCEECGTTWKANEVLPCPEYASQAKCLDADTSGECAHCRHVHGKNRPCDADECHCAIGSDSDTAAEQKR
jgi:hypothetical protein